ncbi:MAG: FGGY family carbohydrate kinase, partial [Gammaproteobacteria bacterium]|nr:FGGY family carbohydrate kinase [Gammaproteobacteria bacterium]
MTEAYLTLDLGTTRLKAALFDVRGRLLAQVSKRHTEYSQDNRQWQSADEWWHHACESIRQLLNPDIHQQPRLHIRACALSGRAGAAVFIHQTGEVVMHPWLDHRHASYLDDLQSHLHRPAPLYAATMAAKINWLKHQAPEIAREVSHALYAKDLLLYRLTGATVTDPASGPDALRWPAEILDSLGKEARLLPDVAEPWDIVGHVSATASSL